LHIKGSPGEKFGFMINFKINGQRHWFYKSVKVI
jgi:hypothetical protein